LRGYQNEPEELKRRKTSVVYRRGGQKDRRTEQGEQMRGAVCQRGTVCQRCVTVSCQRVHRYCMSPLLYVSVVLYAIKQRPTQPSYPHTLSLLHLPTWCTKLDIWRILFPPASSPLTKIEPPCVADSGTYPACTHVTSRRVQGVNGNIPGRRICQGIQISNIKYLRPWANLGRLISPPCRKRSNSSDRVERGCTIPAIHSVLSNCVVCAMQMSIQCYMRDTSANY
jgi:hypothetical protein